MKVKIKDIEKIVSLLLNKIIENKGEEIELMHDFYWEVQEDDLFNAYLQPENLTLGQLSDELLELNRLKEFPEEIIAYDLKRVSTIMRALSIENKTSF